MRVMTVQRSDCKAARAPVATAAPVVPPRSRARRFRRSPRPRATCNLRLHLLATSVFPRCARAAALAALLLAPAAAADPPARDYGAELIAMIAAEQGAASDGSDNDWWAFSHAAGSLGSA